MKPNLFINDPLPSSNTFAVWSPFLSLESQMRIFGALYFLFLSRWQVGVWKSD